MRNTKDLDEQYTPDIVFLFCTAVFFILMSLLQVHYIILPCVVYKKDHNALNSFSLPYNYY